MHLEVHSRVGLVEKRVVALTNHHLGGEDGPLGDGSDSRRGIGFDVFHKDYIGEHVVARLELHPEELLVEGKVKE